MGYNSDMSRATLSIPGEHRFTVQDYYRMGEVGIIPPEQKTELIDGKVVYMAPPGSEHSGTVSYLMETFAPLVNRAMISPQNPVRLNNYNEPQPDLAMLRRRKDFYSETHPQPADVLLMIEVADSSLLKDTKIKRPKYAEAGIAEYWIIDLNFRCVHICREPDGKEYRSIRKLSRGSVAPLAFPDFSIKVSDLFPPGLRSRKAKGRR